MDMGKTCVSYTPKIINHLPKLSEPMFESNGKGNQTKSKWLSSYIHQKVFSYQYDMVSVFSIQGKRATMEDKFRVVQQKSPFPILIFGVFDGHGGSFAVEYVESKLIPNILNAMNYYLKQTGPKFNQIKSASPSNSDKKTHSFHLSSTERSIMYNQILNQEILALDKLLLQKADSLNNNSGTTCLLGILYEDDLVLANTGDCRAMIYDSKGRTFQLTVDHKPQNTSERERIRKAGGFVTLSQAGIWRLNGILSVSRGFGDLSLKRYNNVITAKPDIHIYPLLNPPNLCGIFDDKTPKNLVYNSNKDGHGVFSAFRDKFNSSDRSSAPAVSSLRLEPKFMVLASDGLWNSMSNSEVTEFLLSPTSKRTSEEYKTASQVSHTQHKIMDRFGGLIEREADFGARALALHALKLGSTDNVTVMIVKFKTHNHVMPQAQTHEELENYNKFGHKTSKTPPPKFAEPGDTIPGGGGKQRRTLTPDIINGKISIPPIHKSALQYEYRDRKSGERILNNNNNNTFDHVVARQHNLHSKTQSTPIVATKTNFRFSPHLLTKGSSSNALLNFPHPAALPVRDRIIIEEEYLPIRKRGPISKRLSYQEDEGRRIGGNPFLPKDYALIKYGSRKGDAVTNVSDHLNLSSSSIKRIDHRDLSDGDHHHQTAGHHDVVKIKNLATIRDTAVDESVGEGRRYMRNNNNKSSHHQFLPFDSSHHPTNQNLGSSSAAPDEISYGSIATTSPKRSTSDYEFERSGVGQCKSSSLLLMGNEFAASGNGNRNGNNVTPSTTITTENNAGGGYTLTAKKQVNSSSHFPLVGRCFTPPIFSSTAPGYIKTSSFSPAKTFVSLVEHGNNTTSPLPPTRIYANPNAVNVLNDSRPISSNASPTKLPKPVQESNNRTRPQSGGIKDVKIDREKSNRSAITIIPIQYTNC